MANATDFGSMVTAINGQSATTGITAAVVNGAIALTSSKRL